MNNRVAVVTGGIGGLGSAICIQLARAGRRVIAADLDGNPGRVARFEREVDGFDIRFAPLDASDFDACAAFVADVEQAHGSLDVLVNAAGITRDTTLRKMDRAQWDAVLSVNLDSVFNLCRHAVEGMMARGFGRIVNIASRSVKSPHAELGLSNGARTGLVGFASGLARQTVGKNVTINTLLPGIFDSDGQREHVAKLAETSGRAYADIWNKRAANNPAGRYGQPSEIGAYFAFLVSEHAGFITGQSLLIDGGETLGTF